MSMTRSDRNALKSLFERIDKAGGGELLNMRG